MFGLSAGSRRVRATFWLLDAPDSLREQSHANPDGTGLGTFSASGDPVIEKQPLAGFDDRDFAREARDRTSSTFVAHVRKSSGTPVAQANTHPFALDGRIFAHNGVVGDIERLEAHLGAALQRVTGDTDSERVFALTSAEIARAGGDVAAGITAAMGWIASNLPVMSANFVLVTPEDLWALRWPATHELYVLDRRSPDAPLRHESAAGTRVTSDHLGEVPSVVVASEPLDADDWRLLEPGTLLHVNRTLALTEERILGA
ncbi:class II glutamine amidotransferase [Nigerium massiliense]|uniref:class II glutamine amidotransferase n=1 Tax=Nigerium massiliense TaxID=1522317 RepID=UPI001C470E8C|nr:class II glutamine amidotransferase [Nigerium massiliense]